MKVSVILLCAVWAGLTDASSWSYSGMSNWGNHFPDCNGRSQSPINIPTWKALVDPALGQFTPSIFESVPSKMTIENSGHSLKVSVFDSGYTIADASLLPGNFSLAQYHFHWARSPLAKGSEHYLNGRRYFGELHLVHYNGKYPRLDVAAMYPDGLAVLGFFIEIGDDHNSEFDQILDLVESTKSGEKVVVSEPFSVGSLLPEDMSRYYRYQGSLTTPPCYESVTWTVFRYPIKISLKQARMFASQVTHQDENGNDVRTGKNFRRIQRLNGRVITQPPVLHCDYEF